MALHLTNQAVSCHTGTLSKVDKAKAVLNNAMQAVIAALNIGSGDRTVATVTPVRDCVAVLKYMSCDIREPRTVTQAFCHDSSKRENVSIND